MCTNPLVVKRSYPSIGTREYVVPCGKCADCVKKKQSEFAALSLHQGLQSGSVHFFTFTYRPEALPIAISVDTPEGVPQLIGFERGEAALTSGFGKEFMNRVVRVSSDYRGEFYNCASLCREDIKLTLKRFRAYEKSMRPAEKLDFKYAVFGEYGEQRGRPHYHGLFFGLSDRQALSLLNQWQAHYGFCHCPSIEGKSGTSLDDLTKLSLYVSKYISKADFTRWKHILPYVEKPRRQSSLNFGDFSNEELSKLRGFMMGAICPQDLNQDFLSLISWILSRLDAQVFRLLVDHSLSQNV